MATSPGSPAPEGAPQAPIGATAPSNAPPAEAPVLETHLPSNHPEHSVEAALAASTRAEATLSALHRAIQQVTQGVSGAREANDQLAAELQRVREMLASSNEQRLVFKNQISLLAQQLEDARSDREFLIQEQDRFLTGLLDEQEATVDRLVGEREEAYARLEKQLRQSQETAPPAATNARRTHPGLGDATPLAPSVRPVLLGDHEKNVEKLLAERDRSREVLRRLQQQRDDAQQALVQVTAERDRFLSELARVAPGRVPAARPLISPEDARRTQRAIPQSAMRNTDPSPPDAADGIGERMTAPPAENLAAAIALSRPSPAGGIPAQSAPTNEPKPPLKRKPDPTTQALGGYSLRVDDAPDAPSGEPGGSSKRG